MHGMATVRSSASTRSLARTARRPARLGTRKARKSTRTEGMERLGARRARRAQGRVTSPALRSARPKRGSCQA